MWFRGRALISRWRDPLMLKSRFITHSESHLCHLKLQFLLGIPGLGRGYINMDHRGDNHNAEVRGCTTDPQQTTNMYFYVVTVKEKKKLCIARTQDFLFVDIYHCLWLLPRDALSSFVFVLDKIKLTTKQ